MAYTLLVDNAVQRDGFSLAGAVNEFSEFSAGGGVDTVESAAESGEAAANEAAYQEINQLMKGMAFRSG